MNGIYILKTCKLLCSRHHWNIFACVSKLKSIRQLRMPVCQNRNVSEWCTTIKIKNWSNNLMKNSNLWSKLNLHIGNLQKNMFKTYLDYIWLFLTTEIMKMSENVSLSEWQFIRMTYNDKDEKLVKKLAGKGCLMTLMASKY